MTQHFAPLSAILPQPMSAYRAVAIGAAFCVCYLLVAWATRIYLVRPYSVVPWNPSAGIALAFLLVMGARFWPALAVASCLNLVLRDTVAPPFFALLRPCVITAGYAGMAWLLREKLGFRLEFDRLRDLLTLVIIAAIGTLLIAIAFVSVIRFDNAMTDTIFQHIVLRSWIGHLIGVIVITPLLLLLTDLPRTICAMRCWSLREIAAQLCTTIGTLWIIFSSGWEQPDKLFYLLFIPLIWIVMRYAITGAVLCNAVIQFGLIVAIVVSDYQDGMSVTELQFLMLAVTVAGLFLGMTVTENQATHDALNHSESRLRAIVSTASDSIMMVDERGTIVAANPATTRTFDFAEHGLVGVPVQNVLPDFERCARHKEISETTGIRGDGARFPAELTVGVTGNGTEQLRIVITRDVTRRKETEVQLSEQRAELNRTARLAAAGEVAAALAHELHQPLAAIRNYARASSMLTQTTGGGEIINKVEREAARAAEIVQRLRDFFRTGSSRLERVLVGELVDAAIKPMQGEAARQNIALETEITCGEIEMLVDKVQIETVIHTLISNAFEAMASVNDGAKRVKVVATELDCEWLRLSVIDTGPGVSQAMIARLFEPFATTKSTGTGLGLAMARSIVEAQAGKLWAEPVASGGTAFHFTLPRADHKEALDDEH